LGVPGRQQIPDIKDFMNKLDKNLMARLRLNARLMSLRAASLFCVFAFAALTTQAQGPGGPPPGAGENIQSLADKLAALATRVAKLEGEIVAADLVGTYALHGFQSELRAAGAGDPDPSSVLRVRGDGCAGGRRRRIFQRIGEWAQTDFRLPEFAGPPQRPPRNATPRVDVCRRYAHCSRGLPSKGRCGRPRVGRRGSQPGGRHECADDLHPAPVRRITSTPCGDRSLHSRGSPVNF